MEENHIHIYLNLYDFAWAPNELTKMLGLEPTKSGVKGEKYFLGKGKNKIEREYISNWWRYKESHTTETKWQQKFVDDFVQRIIEPRIETLKMITEQGSGELALAPHYYDEWNMGFDFNLDVLRILTDSGLILNMDIYCFQKESKIHNS